MSNYFEMSFTYTVNDYDRDIQINNEAQRYYVYGYTSLYMEKALNI